MNNSLSEINFSTYIQENFETIAQSKFTTFNFNSEKDLIRSIYYLCEYFDFMNGEFWYNDDIYTFKIEAWEAICIEEIVSHEKGDWNNREYLNEIIYEEHHKLLNSFKLLKSGQVVINELLENSSFGKSLIVLRK